MAKMLAGFGLLEYQAEQGRIIIDAPRFDYDSFPQLAAQLTQLLSAQIMEQQCDADIHSWLIDFEGCPLLLKGEHYSESLWLEALNRKTAQEELDFLAALFSSLSSARA